MDGISATDIRLSGLPAPLKTVISLFLVLMGLAYGVSVLNLYLTYHLGRR